MESNVPLPFSDVLEIETHDIRILYAFHTHSPVATISLLAHAKACLRAQALPRTAVTQFFTMSHSPNRAHSTQTQLLSRHPQSLVLAEDREYSILFAQRRAFPAAVLSRRSRIMPPFRLRTCLELSQARIDLHIRNHPVTQASMPALNPVCRYLTGFPSAINSQPFAFSRGWHVPTVIPAECQIA